MVPAGVVGLAGGAGAPGFVELCARTAFSFGDGAVTPERLADRAAALGYESLGITDAADLGGVVRFALAARRCGVRPVVGAELVVDGRPLTLLVRTAEGCRNLGALVTLARSGELGAWPDGGPARGVPPRHHDAVVRAGGRHRPDAGSGLAPRTPAADRPPRGQPAVGWTHVAERSAGLHLLTGPADGALAAALLGAPDAPVLTPPAGAERLLARYRDAFGDRVAVEAQLHDRGRW